MAATDTKNTLLAYPCHSEDFEPIMTGATTLAEPSAMKGTRISKKKDGPRPGQVKNQLTALQYMVPQFIVSEDSEPLLC